MAIRKILLRFMQIVGPSFWFVAGLACHASAGTILYSYHSICLTGCTNIGLRAGSIVGGTIGLQSALVVPNGTISARFEFSPGPIASFDLSFGDQTIKGPSAGVPVGGSITLNASTSAATSFGLDAGSTAMEGTEALFSDSNWAVLVPLVPFGPVLGGFGTLTRMTPISEPATIVVVSSAMLGLFLVRIVRR